MSLYLSQKKLFILLLSAFLIGFFLCLLYDGIRLLRLARKPKRKAALVWHWVLVSWEDLLFFLFCGITFSILFFVANSGKVRPSAFVMAFLGFLFCRMTLSGVTFPLAVRLCRKGKALLLFLLTPARRLFAKWHLKLREKKEKNAAQKAIKKKAKLPLTKTEAPSPQRHRHIHKKDVIS